MTTAAGATATTRVPMSSTRKTALVAGVLYLLTFVSIPTLFLYDAVKSPNYILGAGPDTPVIVGGILEMIVALAGIGTAVVLFPVLKRQNEGVALGFVGSRTLEAATIFVGVAFLLTIVTLRQAGAGAGALVTSHALVTLYNRMFLIGQSFMPAVDDLLLGFLLYQSRLVPRVLPLHRHSSERPCSSRPTSPCCSASGAKRPRWRRSPHSRSRSLSFRWASTWSSKALSPRRSSPARREMPNWTGHLPQRRLPGSSLLHAAPWEPG